MSTGSSATKMRVAGNRLGISFSPTVGRTPGAPTATATGRCQRRREFHRPRRPGVQCATHAVGHELREAHRPSRPAGRSTGLDQPPLQRGQRKANLLAECALGEITARMTGQQLAPCVVAQAATRTGNRGRRRDISMVHEAQRNGLTRHVPDAPRLPLRVYLGSGRVFFCPRLMGNDQRPPSLVILPDHAL
jgi:hypothetical protein